MKASVEFKWSVLNCYFGKKAMINMVIQSFIRYLLIVQKQASEDTPMLKLSDCTGQEFVKMLKSRLTESELIQKISDLAVFLVLEGPTQPFWVMEFVLAGGVDFLLKQIEEVTMKQDSTEEDDRLIFSAIRSLRLLMNVKLFVFGVF